MRIELSPSSIIVSLTSALVWPTNAIGEYPLRAQSITVSDPVRVFPKPLPDRKSHVNQFPCGGNCEGRAQNFQSYRIARVCSSFRLFRISDLFKFGSDARYSAGELFTSSIHCLLYIEYVHVLAGIPVFEFAQSCIQTILCFSCSL